LFDCITPCAKKPWHRIAMAPPPPLMLYRAAPQRKEERRQLDLAASQSHPHHQARRAARGTNKTAPVVRTTLRSTNTTLIDLVDFERTMEDHHDDDEDLEQSAGDCDILDDDDKVHRMDERRFTSSPTVTTSSRDLIVCGSRTFEVIHVEDVWTSSGSSGADADDEVGVGEDYDHQIDEWAVLEAFPPPLLERDDDCHCSLSWHGLMREHRWEQCTHLLRQMLADPDATLSDDALLEPGSDTSLLHTAAAQAPRSLLLSLLAVVAQKRECDTGSNTTLFVGGGNARGERLRTLLLSGDGRGNTPLHLACANLQRDETRENQSSVVDVDEDNDNDDDADMFAAIKIMLVTAPGALETCNNAGDTPLHLLLASDLLRNDKDNQDDESTNCVQEAITSLLQIAGDLTSVQNKRGLTLLHIAIGNQCSDNVCRLVLEATPTAALLATDHYGMTPLHYGAAFGTASLQVLRRLVERQPSNLVLPTRAGDTPLHLFVANNNSAQNVARKVDEQDEYNDAIHRLDLLCTEHATQTALSMRNNEELTPVHCCALFGAPWQVTQAVAAAAPETIDLPASKSRSTALHLAVLCFIDAVNTDPTLSHVRRKALLKNISILTTTSPSACQAVDAYGQTALLLAIQCEAIPSRILRRLVDAAPSSLQIADPQGFLPVHRACQTGHVSSSLMKGTCVCVAPLQPFFFPSCTCSQCNMYIALVSASPSSRKSRTAAV
jgi:ankyrin repeat protein